MLYLPVSSAFIPRVLFYPGSIETGGTSVDFEIEKRLFCKRKPLLPGLPTLRTKIHP